MQSSSRKVWWPAALRTLFEWVSTLCFRALDLLINLRIVLVYGLDCRYERERKKRGKGSLTNSSKENCAASSEIFSRQNTNNAPMTPVTAKTSPASSPCTFHLSIPPSHLFNGNVPEVKECLPEGFMPIPSCSRPSQNSESQNQFCKIGPGSTRRAYLSVLTDQNHCDAQSISTQSSCHRAPESTCYASQSWSRGYDAVDQPKIPLSPNTISMPPEDYQLLPYMPICASCQTNPSVRLYPGSIVWLPSPPSPYYAPTECGAVLEGEAGTYCFVDQNNVEKGT